MSRRAKRQHSPFRIVPTAHKGGVGETTAAVPAQPSLYDVVMGDAEAADAIVTSSTPNVDILPADLDPAGADITLLLLLQWQTRL